MKRTIAIWSTLWFFYWLLVAGSLTLTYFSTRNKEVQIRNLAKAQQDVCKTARDKMWCIVKGKAKVADKYAEEFQKSFTGLMNARYAGDDNVMFKWIQERNPTFSADLYKDISTSIEGYTVEWMNAQNRLIDIKREHNNMLSLVPSKWFLGGVDTLNIVIVLSSSTTKAYETGIDDEVDPF